MLYREKTSAVYAGAQRQARQFMTGLCTVYNLQPPERDGIYYGGFADFSGWEPVAGLEKIPCHLAFLQNGPAVEQADGSSVEARCRLFLPLLPEGKLPAGSRVRVEQQGQVYWLACSGLAASYPTHLEVEVKLLAEKA